MSFTIEDVDLSALEEARKCLTRAGEFMGHQADWLTEPDANLREAIEAVEGDGTFVEKMTTAVDCCHEAMDQITDTWQVIVDEHQAGHIHASDETVAYVLSELNQSLEAIDDFATKNLKELQSL